MTFPTSGILPKLDIQAKAFLERFPSADGRGIRVAVVDTGSDLGAQGLQACPDGSAKIVDAYDATGSGDVDTSQVVASQATDDGRRYVVGLTKRKLFIPASFTNPKDEWHVGIKRLSDIFGESLIKRLKELRKKDWDAKQNALMSSLREMDDGFDPKKQADIKLLEQQANQFADLADPGPIADVLCWHNGTDYVAVVDCPPHDSAVPPLEADLSARMPLRRYGFLQEKALFCTESMCWFGVQILNNGNTVSLVAAPSGHGTHVSSIIGAYHPNHPELNGIAPGVQLVDIKIGDCRLKNLETIGSMERALVLAKNLGCHAVNMSFGEATRFPNEGRFIDVLRELINDHNMVFVTSCGNSGPALSTVGAPATFDDCFGVGALTTPELVKSTLGKINTPDATSSFTWTSRGPTTDGHIGCTICAPGGAIASVPAWMLKKSQYMNGTSMASPNACGGLALVLSKLLQDGRWILPHQLKRGAQATAKELTSVDALTGGAGLLQVCDLYDCASTGMLDEPKLIVTTSRGSKRGLYLREPDQVAHPVTELINVAVQFHKDTPRVNELYLTYERRVILKATQPWVKVPESFFLVSGTRNFELRVDPGHRAVTSGLNFAYVNAYDSALPSAPPLFQFPITLVKPIAVPEGAVELDLMAGQVERYFLRIPAFTSLLEVKFEALASSVRPDSARSIWVHALYLQGGQRCDCSTVCQMRSTDSNTLSISLLDPVLGFASSKELTVEVAIAHYVLALEAQRTSLSVSFKTSSVNVSPAPILIDGASGYGFAETYITEKRQRVDPRCIFTDLRRTYLPESGAKPVPISAEAGTTLSGERLHSITLKYTWDQPIAGRVSPSFPLLADRLYDSVVGGALWEIYDVNGQYIGAGEVFTSKIDLKHQKGYKCLLVLRSHSMKMLQGFDRLPLVIDTPLGQTIRCALYDDLNQLSLSFGGPNGNTSKASAKTIAPGSPHRCYIKAPDIPSVAAVGDILVGLFHTDAKDPIKPSLQSRANVGGRGEKCIGVPVFFFPTRIAASAPPSSTAATATAPSNSEKKPVDTTEKALAPDAASFPEKGAGKDEGEASATADKASLSIAELKRDADAAWFEKMPLPKKREAKDYLDKFAQEWPADFLPLHSFRLQVAETPEEIKAAAEKVLEVADTMAVRAHFGQQPLDTPEFVKLRKGFQERKTAIVEALKKKAILKMDAKDDEGFNAATDEIQTWTEFESLDDLYALRMHKARINGQLGKCLQFVDKMIRPQSKKIQTAPKKQYIDERLKLIEELGWSHIAFRENQLMLMAFPPKSNL